MDLPAHFWSRRSDSNRGRRSPRPPSAYSSRATAQHTWGSPQVQVFQQECQRSRMLHKHFERNWTSRLPPRGDYSPRSLARQLAPTPVDTLALAAPFTTWGSLRSPAPPRRSSVRSTRNQRSGGGAHTTDPSATSLEPAIGLEPMTCALRVQKPAFFGRTRRYLQRIFEGFSKIQQVHFIRCHPPSPRAE